MPIDCSGSLFAGMAGAGRNRGQGCTNFQWVAPQTASCPPLFDDVPLERYGQTVCPVLQPVISGLRFYGTFAVLPCKLAADGICQPIYTSGYYRPGSSDVPCVRQRLH